MILDPSGVPYGSALTIEQRLARVEQLLRSKRLGRAQKNTATNPGAMGAGTGAEVLTLAVTGNGVDPVTIEGYMSHVFSSAAGALAIQIWDTAVGNSVNVSELTYAYRTWAANAYHPMYCQAEIAAFSGTKTLRLAIHNVNGSTVAVEAGSGGRAATWLKATYA